MDVDKATEFLEKYENLAEQIGSNARWAARPLDRLGSIVRDHADMPEHVLRPLLDAKAPSRAEQGHDLADELKRLNDAFRKAIGS